jgi:hypothetical protein
MAIELHGLGSPVDPKLDHDGQLIPANRHVGIVSCGHCTDTARGYKLAY